MGQFVELTFGENETEFTVAFDSLEDIDFVIERLEELRAELEHKIEMAKQKKRKKRKRAKIRRKFEDKELEDTLNKILSEMNKFDNLSIDEKINDIMRDYESLEDGAKEILRPLIEFVKSLHDLHKK